MIAALHTLADGPLRARATAALGFAAAFAALIFFNYIVQTTFLPALVQGGSTENAVLISAFALSNPRALGWAIEMWGYAVLGVATWLIAPVLANRGRFGRGCRGAVRRQRPGQHRRRDLDRAATGLGHAPRGLRVVRGLEPVDDLDDGAGRRHLPGESARRRPGLGQADWQRRQPSCTRARVTCPKRPARQIADALNARLADGLDLHSQIKVAHWNIKGPQFAALHPLFETFAVSLANHNDGIAERAVTLGAKAYGTVRHVAKTRRCRSTRGDDRAISNT